MHWHSQGQWHEAGKWRTEAEPRRHPVPHLLPHKLHLYQQHQLHQDPITGAATKISDRYQEGGRDYNKIC